MNMANKATRKQLDIVMNMDRGEECVIGPWKFARTFKDSYWADRLDDSAIMFGDDLLVKYYEGGDGHESAHIHICYEGETASIILYDLVEKYVKEDRRVMEVVKTDEDKMKEMLNELDASRNRLMQNLKDYSAKGMMGVKETYDYVISLSSELQDLKESMYCEMNQISLLMVKDVYSEVPDDNTRLLCKGTTYDATADTHGAIAVLLSRDGNVVPVGVKPGEFVFISAPKKVFDIWFPGYDADSLLKIVHHMIRIEGEE